MAMALHEDLYFCLTDRGAIFLDLSANRYFGLSGATDRAFRRIVAGDALDPALEQELKPLMSSGLLHRAEDIRSMAPPAIEPPIMSFSAGGSGAVASTTLSALSRHAAVRLEMRVRGLKAMMARRRARKSAALAHGPIGSRVDAADPVLAAHRAVDRLLGGANRCLARSLSLIDHLAQRGAYPNLVIGVRAGAFSAHCWVQQGSTVLNDELDRVRLFTPILVL